MMIQINIGFYGRGFKSRSHFSWTHRNKGENVIFRADNSSSGHIEGRNKCILVLGKGPTQSLDNATITAETKYPINFTVSGQKFVLSLRYSESNSFFIC